MVNSVERAIDNHKRRPIISFVFTSDAICLSVLLFMNTDFGKIIDF